MIIKSQMNILGLWTLLTLLSDEGLPCKEGCHSSLTVNVKCPSGKIVSCSLEYSSKTMVLSRVLFEEVAKQTGVPIKLQMLPHRMNPIQPDIPLQKYRLQDGCCIELVIKGVGGGNGDETDTGKNAIIDGYVRTTCYA